MAYVTKIKMCQRLTFLISFVVFFIQFLSGYAFAEERTRDDIINARLTCMSRQWNEKERINWDQVCYTAFNEDRRISIINDELDHYSQMQVKPLKKEVQSSDSYKISEAPAIPYKFRESSPPQKPSPLPATVSGEAKSNKVSFFNRTIAPLFKQDDRLTDIDLGMEVYRYTYALQSIDNFIYTIRQEGPRNKGYHFSIFGDFTKRISENKQIHSLTDAFKDGNKINMFKVESRAAWGFVNHKADNTESKEGVRNFELELRGLTGYDIPISEATAMTPFIGFGFRYFLEDSSRGNFHSIDIDPTDFRREVRFFYLPFGFEIAKEFSNDMSFGFSFEYDQIITGKHEFHFEDQGINNRIADGTWHVTQAANPDQEHGFGLRGAVKLTKEKKGFDVFAEPFVRYWHLDESEPYSLEIDNGSDLIWLGIGSDVLLIEPENDTVEYGLKFGIRY